MKPCLQTSGLKKNILSEDYRFQQSVFIPTRRSVAVRRQQIRNQDKKDKKQSKKTQKTEVGDRRESGRGGALRTGQGLLVSPH